MCRNIKQLRQPDQLPTEDELRAAALQYVRKVSGYRAPSRLNQAAFDQAVDEVAATTKKLLNGGHARDPAGVKSISLCLTNNSALKIEAPAAPRIVLCDNTTNLR